MKKICIPLTLIVLVACSGMNRKPVNKQDRKIDDAIFESVQTVPAHDENTHELVDATADDVVIKQAAGVAEIDDEISPSEDEGIPYSRDFLHQKKTKRMQFWVDYFTKKNRERFQRFINNGEEYRHHIEEIFVEHGLPKELYFVGLIESGYYLGAKSHASAVGPWQFIRGTGSRYGLSITSELDERQDLFKASHAAARYFKDLHNIFSSWELALSAYNAGEYGIIRRILKHGTRDFYKLSKDKKLPTETINYVPKVLAAMHVVNNAAKYGFHIPKKKHRLFDRTELKAIKKNVSLNTIASRLNTSVELLKKLNPELKSSRTPKRFAGTYFLRVPKTRYNYDSSEIADVGDRPEKPSELNRRTASTETIHAVKVRALLDRPAPVIEKPTTHKVTRGETLITIARKYGTTPRALAEANNFKSWKYRVRTGQKLQLSEGRIVASTPNVKILNKPIIYKVKSGDNLTDLARIFGTSLSELKATNKLKRGKILVGQKIVLPDTKKGIYTIKAGDHLSYVAKKFNQPMEALVKMNSLKRRQVYPGQKIIVNID